LDALPPTVYAANDQRPRGAREVDLCERASTTDWLYMGLSGASFVGAMYADVHYLKFVEQPGVRMIGPGLVGLTWGFTLGGGYLAQPKCSPDWVEYAPPEGDARTTWPIALGLGLFAGITAPMLEYYFLGGVPVEWSVWERRGRLFSAGGGALIGSFLPYLLPPKTWRNAKELEKLRLGVGFVTYTTTF
jgi:hypothetical protein